MSPSTEHAWTVIMAGGVGSRFWPLSRAAWPKQLADLFGQGSMLAATVDRMLPLVPAERQVVVTGRIIGDAVAEALGPVDGVAILAEPMGRNTAAAIGWAALHVLQADPDGVLAVLPADQHIVHVERYRETVASALAFAAEGSHLVTLGITPTRPETGYGYIEVGRALVGEICSVDAFREKPDLETAIRYLAGGKHLWNAGMFFMGADLIAGELRRFEPALMEGLDRLFHDPPGDLAEIYASLPSISIDYAVMERSDRVAVLPGDFGWSDVGSWQSLFDLRPDGVASFHRGSVVEIGGTGNVLFAQGGLVATVGVDDLVVVHTPDATLVCRKEDSQRVRDVVDALRTGGKEELL